MLAGDKYARQKAVDGLDGILPDGEGGAHEGARAARTAPCPKDEFDALIAELFEDYTEMEVDVLRTAGRSIQRNEASA